MKRPILIITLGFINGILGGLYFNIAPFVFIFTIFIVLIIKKLSLENNNKYIRILKLFIKNNIILIFFISSCISSTYIIKINKRYNKIYSQFTPKEIVATVISNKKESEYKYTYKIKLEEYRGVNFLLRVAKSKKIDLNYGDKVKINGEYVLPDISRNYGGFNYREYLKTQKVYGIYEADKIQILSTNNLSKISIYSNSLKNKIITGINKILPEDTKQLFLGILIGYDDNLAEEIQESFKKSSLTHLLAVSGAHISYIILGIGFLFKSLKLPKRLIYVLTIFFLIFFMYITEFSSSVVRATVMGIILLMSLIFFKKNDIFNSISISILIILIENPYRILDIGLILSYFATIGIICFSRMRNIDYKNEISRKTELINYLKELIYVTIYANIFVIPIMAYNFNAISLTFVLSNLIAGILIGPITIGGFILSIILFLSHRFAYIIGKPYNLLLELLIESTNIISLIPLSEILVPTPSKIIIVIYYLILFIYIAYKFFKKEYFNRYLVKKFFIFLYYIYNWLKINYKKILIYILILVILINLILNIIPKKLKIYFIDQTCPIMIQRLNGIFQRNPLISMGI